MTQVLFANAALLDLERGERRPGTIALVEDDRIVEMSEGSSRAEGARRIDASGRTLMHGLIDAREGAWKFQMGLWPDGGL